MSWKPLRNVLKLEQLFVVERLNSRSLWAKHPCEDYPFANFPRQKIRTNKLIRVLNVKENRLIMA